MRALARAHQIGAGPAQELVDAVAIAPLSALERPDRPDETPPTT